MSEPASFRTKTGRCVVTADTLELERGGVRGAAAAALFGQEKRRATLIYVGIVIVLLWSGARAFAAGAWVGTVGYVTLAAWLATTVARGRDLSVATVLPRAVTRRVVVVPGRRWRTRPHLIVHFEELGHPARRLILLPGTRPGGRSELERAVETLRAAGWPVDTPAG